ncbi:uncharacterized protein LOC108023185 [Drosophila biarmipes]|uniref:uncharacterized protein LOC108023185 n=1 Tax=Drosophila biarmipes TaxID=125945 RepID=UPI0007E80574|nr:uncharacterized protein LOC108023185 [Drosophila biarmipes]
MNTVNDIKINSSVWMNKSYSSVLKSAPLPVPGYRGPLNTRRFPVSSAQGKPVTPAKSLPPMNGQRTMGNGGPVEGPNNSRFSHYDQAVKEQNRKIGKASMNPGRIAATKENEPYFASNLKYYPHLPQPRWVEHYQTFAELKQVLSDGDLSQVESPNQVPKQAPKLAPKQAPKLAPKQSPMQAAKPAPTATPILAKMHQARGKSVTPAQVHNDQPAQAPPRRYSMTRKNPGDGPEETLTNLFLAVSKHLLRQPQTEVQRQFQIQMKKPVQQDPLMAQFVARQKEVRFEDDLKEAPRRLQPSWCFSSNEEASNGEAFKPSGSSKPKPDTPRSWRSEGTAHLLPRKSEAKYS